MYNTANLHILYGLNELVHDNGHFSLLQLVCFDMLKQLTTSDLFHNDEHVLLCLVGFSHLNYVFVADKLGNLIFFSEEILFSLA
jgi:hypothetical protein